MQEDSPYMPAVIQPKANKPRTALTVYIVVVCILAVLEIATIIRIILPGQKSPVVITNTPAETSIDTPTQEELEAVPTSDNTFLATPPPSVTTVLTATPVPTRKPLPTTSTIPSNFG